MDDETQADEPAGRGPRRGRGRRRAPGRQLLGRRPRGRRRRAPRGQLRVRLARDRRPDRRRTTSRTRCRRSPTRSTRCSRRPIARSPCGRTASGGPVSARTIRSCRSHLQGERARLVGTRRPARARGRRQPVEDAATAAQLAAQAADLGDDYIVDANASSTKALWEVNAFSYRRVSRRGPCTSRRTGGVRRLRRGCDDDRAERRRRPAHRRDREPGHPQPRDHAVLLAARGRLRGAQRRGRELVHVRHVGLAAGGADDPRRGPARAARAQARRGRWLLHPFATLWRRLLRRGLFQPRDAARPADGRAAHAVRRVRARERRGRAREPEGVRGDRARVRALPRRVPAGRADAPCRGSSTRLRPGDPPDGQRYLRQAFAHYERRAAERDPKARAELAVLANLEIGLHEQTRLQPEIREALDAALRHAGGSRAARARRAVPVRGALVAGRAAPGRGRRRRRRRRASQRASTQRSRAR